MGTEPEGLPSGDFCADWAAKFRLENPGGKVILEAKEIYFYSVEDE